MAYPIMMMQLTLGSRVLRFCTAAHNVVYEGESYTAYGDLLSISDPVEATEITSEGVEISLSAVNIDYLSEIDSGAFLKAPVDILLAELPDGTNVIPDGTAAYYHRGYADTPRQLIDYDAGSMTLVMETKNILGDLDRTPELTRCNQANHQQRFSGDQFFSFVASAVIDSEEQWIS